MNNKGAGSIFCLISALLTCTTLCVMFVLVSAGCGRQNINSNNPDTKVGWRLCELQEDQGKEPIGNAIPQWVMMNEDHIPLYAVTSSDIDRFNEFAKANFPAFCDPAWTQEQSDSVYLGNGIELFELDDFEPESRVVYYPVITNGVIVSGYQIFETLENLEMGSQMSPFLVNQLNQLMKLTTENDPLILGVNRDNVIGIIGNDYYILDYDHMYEKAIAEDKIPVISKDTVINAMNIFCEERTADVDDWVMVDR